MKDAQTSEQKRDAVEKFLNGQGYPLEFKVARAFRHAFKDVQIHFVSQGEYVPAEDEHSARELDVLVEICDAVSWCLFRVAFVVECKYARNPWAFFDEPAMPQAGITGTSDWLASPWAAVALWVTEHSEAVDPPVLVPVDGPIAFGGCDVRLVDTGAKKPEQVYSTLQSVVSNAARYVGLFDGGDPITIGVAIPVVVVQGDIYRASYDDERGAMVAGDARWVTVGWAGCADSNGRKLVHVVQADALNDWLAEVVKNVEGFCRDFKWSLGAVQEVRETGTAEPLKLPPIPPMLPALLKHAIAFHRDQPVPTESP